MHIHDAVFASTPEGIAILGVGILATVGGTAIGLRRIDYEQMPRVAVVISVFFVVSLIHVPLGVTSTHLVLNGLVGLLLGWAAFPALLIALLLQAVLFGHGGLLALGVNTLTMALPAVVVWYLFRHVSVIRQDGLAFLVGFSAGALAVLLSALLTSLALWLTGSEFKGLATAVFGVHLLMAGVEGLVAGGVMVFLRKVRPEFVQNLWDAGDSARRYVDVWQQESRLE